MWLHKEQVIEKIEDMPQGTFGFIYITTHKPSGISYIGKKSLYHNVKRKLTKKELAEQTGRGRRPTTQVVQKESDWKTYYGSTKQIVELINDGKQEDFTREIIQFVFNKKLLKIVMKSRVIFETKRVDKMNQAWAAAKAPWFRLRLPSCGPGCEPSMLSSIFKLL